MFKPKRQLILLSDKKSFGSKSKGDKAFFFLTRLFERLGKTPDQTVKLISFITVVLCLTAGALCATQIPNLSTTYSIKQFFPEGHHLFEEAKEIRRTFYLEENPGFLIVLNLPKDQKTWLEPSQIQTLKKITQILKQDPHIKNVNSLSEVEGLFEFDSSLNIGPIFDTLPASEWKSYISSRPLVAKQLLTPDLHSTLITAEPDDLSPKALVQLSQKLRNEIQALSPESEIEIGGVPAIQGQFAKRLLSELKLYLILCLIIFCLMFSFLIRGKGALFLVFASLALGNTVALGIISYLNIPFSVLLSTLPIILSIIIVSLSVHCLHLWAEKREELFSTKSEVHLSEKFSTCLSVILDLALPNFLGTLTTAVGFASLAFSSIPIIQHFGLAVTGAVLGGWLFTHIVLLGFMHFTHPRLAGSRKLPSFWMVRSLKWSHSSFVLILITVLGFGAIGTQIEFSSRLFDDLPAGDKVRKVTEDVDQKFGGVVSYDLVLKANEDGFFKSPENTQKVAEALKEIEVFPAVGSAFGFTSLLSQEATSDQAKLAETFFLFSLSASNPLSHYITDDGKTTRLAIRFKDVPGKEIKMGREKITSLIKDLFPSGVTLTEAGLAVRAHTINEEVSRSLIFGFLESLFFIGLFLVFVFRSVRWALVSCVPNLIPPAVLLGTMALFETPVKPTIALIFSIALGFAFNNTVYLLSRLKKLSDAQGPNLLNLRQALIQESYPGLSETLLMFFGFMIFLSSTFQVNQIFGAYMLLSILSGYVGDYIFLPALLKNFPGLLGRKEEFKENEPPSRKEEKSRQLPPETQVAASLVLVLTAALFSPSSHSAPSSEVKALLAKVQKKVEAKDDQATVKMVITEPNGQTREREMELATLRDDRFYARVKILSPADVKNTGFLAHVTPKDEQHWIYIPSTRKVRRVVGNNKNAGILGSELTIEDLDPSALRASTAKIRSRDKKKIILEVSPESGTSPYTKVLTAISASEYVPLRTLYYKGNKKVKSVDFLNYKKVDGGIWRAQQIKVKNYENKRGTDLFLTEMKSNTGLGKSEFSQNALKFN